jgi:hypothetical protein
MGAHTAQPPLDVLAQEAQRAPEPGARQLATARKLVDRRLRQGKQLRDLRCRHHVLACDPAYPARPTPVLDATAGQRLERELRPAKSCSSIPLNYLYKTRSQPL